MDHTTFQAIAATDAIMNCLLRCDSSTARCALGEDARLYVDATMDMLEASARAIGPYAFAMALETYIARTNLTASLYTAVDASVVTRFGTEGTIAEIASHLTTTTHAAVGLYDKCISIAREAIVFAGASAVADVTALLIAKLGNETHAGRALGAQVLPTIEKGTLLLHKRLTNVEDEAARFCLSYGWDRERVMRYRKSGESRGEAFVSQAAIFRMIIATAAVARPRAANLGDN